MDRQSPHPTAARPPSPRGRREDGNTVKSAVLPVYSMTPFTMLDFPGHTACIIWFCGCNMRCAYCHNPDLIRSKGRGDIEEVMAFLKKRQGLLDGVAISGGEATIYPALRGLIRRIKDMGYAVKLDTNGLKPSHIAALLEEHLLDYIALDYKAPSGKFQAVTGVDRFKHFSTTLDILCTQHAVPFEVRTTVHTALMDEQDVGRIIADLEHRQYTGTYYVQNFCAENARPTLKVLGVQKRTLDTSALPQPEGFTLGFRNF